VEDGDSEDADEDDDDDDDDDDDEDDNDGDDGDDDDDDDEDDDADDAEEISADEISADAAAKEGMSMLRRRTKRMPMATTSSARPRERLGASGGLWEPLEASGSRWELPMGAVWSLQGEPSGGRRELREPLGPNFGRRWEGPLGNDREAFGSASGSASGSLRRELLVGAVQSRHWEPLGSLLGSFFD
jgi:hypothetical protein